MPHVELPDVPERLYHRIESLARVRGRSIGEQVVELLSDALASGDDAVRDGEAALLAEARADRKRANVPFLTEAELQQMKRAGRE